MDRRLISPSNLPTLMMPCPCCGGRMMHLATPEVLPAESVEDVTHSCGQCGTELTRTIRSGSSAWARPRQTPRRVANG